mgnify:CR=1 FL=1
MPVNCTVMSLALYVSVIQLITERDGYFPDRPEQLQAFTIIPENIYCHYLFLDLYFSHQINVPGV